MRHVSLAVGILAAVSLFAGGFGCSKEPPAPQPVVKRQAPMPEAKAPSAPAAEASAKKVEQVALYDPRGKRDPFVSFIKVEERRKAGSDTLALPPLQRYDLGELKFVGVIWTKTGARGLVEDAEGKGYSVTVGTRIGRSGGVVRRITGKEILVREEFVGSRGEKIMRESGIQFTTAGGK
ncbi:pilus assembly protein PilP [Candidatus Deferrimicrobium sp.]|uniref:pilus assembly protein PilP n=1 Tax=Candidatus Deferrimicrobium sp. TaxID=3060586 RepID=UPI002ED78C6C